MLNLSRPSILLLPALLLVACDGKQEPIGTSVHASTAEVRTPISVVQTLLLDARSDEISVGYRIGGGCQVHVTELSLRFDAVAHRAETLVADVTPAPDLCEALVHPEFHASLRDLVTSQAARPGATPAIDLTQVPRLAVVPPPVAIALPAGGVAPPDPLDPLPAAARVVDGLTSVAIDGSSLSFSYEVPGGCETHAPIVRVVLADDDVRGAAGTRAAQVVIVDDGPPDACAGTVKVEGTADLVALARAASFTVTGQTPAGFLRVSTPPVVLTFATAAPPAPKPAPKLGCALMTCPPNYTCVEDPAEGGECVPSR